MHRFIVVVYLMALCLSVAPTPAVAQTEQDAAAAAQTAVDLSYLESIGDVNGLYDRIHPDAHAIIPRAAVIGWYQNEFLPLGPGVAIVTGVRFVEWSWPVTGVAYPVTAEVSFRQPFADGSIADDVVRLVRDGTGQWRWFFGRSREFVEEQIARYAPQVPAAPANIVDFVIADLNTFWSISFSAAGRAYTAPNVVAFSGGTSSACGYVGADTGPGSYCTRDLTIYIDPAWVAYLETEIGDFAWITVFAHEWGHHVQFLERVPRSTAKAHELQADCLAGTYARDAETRGLLDPGDVTEAIAISAAAGDPLWLPADAVEAHGTGDERVAAFMRGYLDGFIGCGFPSTSASQPAAAAPPPPAAAEVDRVLTTPQDVPAGLSLTAESRRTLAQVTANYTNPAETERLFREWGWEENATRSFEASGAGSGVTSVYVSVHRFDTAGGARNALDYSIADQAASTAAREIAVSPLGASTRGLATASDVTIYVQQGSLMIRLTVAGDAGSLLPVAESIVSSMLARAG